MKVEKILNKKVSESVTEQIEKMIEAGTFLPGEKLPSVRELCDMFGVGRSAVRDAITTLKGKGAVTVKQGEGTYICKFDSGRLFNNHLLLPSSEDISQLFQVRKLLEPGIAEIAAENRSEADLELMDALLSGGDDNSWEADYNFHLAIARAAGNEILIQLLEFISASMQKTMIGFHQFIKEDREVFEEITDQHNRIYQMLQNKKPAMAKQLMQEHLDYVEDLLKTSSVLNA
ncbi:FadR family transcriptional regulator [Mesobacillus boroniphilus]|uniref:FadR family transcriptional regulator n=1 Tax=Mesobacillus boroniphilus TaxID=308892 RepID=A0A944CIA0_9BACI|nr:FadR family transcriptional regulator [Mesobacillus boroniphilus]